MGPGNHILDGGMNLPRGRRNLGKERCGLLTVLKPVVEHRHHFYSFNTNSEFRHVHKIQDRSRTAKSNKTLTVASTEECTIGQNKYATMQVKCKQENQKKKKKKKKKIYLSR